MNPTDNEGKIIFLVASILPFTIAALSFFFPNQIINFLNSLSEKKAKATQTLPNILKKSDVKILVIMGLISGIFMILVALFAL